MKLAGALLVVAVVALLGLAPEISLAVAGSYQVTTCNAAPEAGNNSWTWSTTDPSQPDHFAEHVSCPDRIGGSGGLSDQEGGLSTTDALKLSNGAPPGTSAGWTFTAPIGTTIAGLKYERYIGHTIDPDNSWSPALRVDGNIVPDETCLDSVENGETCAVGGPPEQGGEGVFGGLTAHEVSVGIVCLAPTEEVCVAGASQHRLMTNVDYLPAVTAVEVIGEHELRLTFDDGTVGDVSFADRQWTGVFEPLRDPARFANVQIDPLFATIVWPDDGLDMAPEPLYADAKRRPLSDNGREL